METKRIFNQFPFKLQKIALAKFEGIDTFKDRDKVKKTIDDIFNKPDVIEGNPIEKYGETRTTVQARPDYDLPELLNLNNNELGKWLYKSISQAGKEIHKTFSTYNPLQPKNYDEFIFVRNWMNRMYKGSHGAAHDHKSQCDMVCIFYLEAPANCGELIFINQTVPNNNKEPYFKYPKELCYSIKPEPGLLVCHDKIMTHAIGQNDVHDPRTVLILEPFFKSKPIQWLTSK